MNAEKSRPAHASVVTPAQSSPIASYAPGTNRTSEPPTIAHAVVRRGEWRRRIGAPNAVYTDQHAAATSVRPSLTTAEPSVIPWPAETITATPADQTRVPRS